MTDRILTINDRPEIDAFISKAFNSYNGKVNTFNQPAVLVVDWLEHPLQNKAATSVNPNIVTMFPKTMLRYLPEERSYKYQIIVTVIHELLHTDQVIDYPRMMTDGQYKDLIERIVEMEAHLYIAQHISQIRNDFGLDNLIDHCQFYSTLELLGYETGQLYQRRDYPQHFINLIHDMLRGSEPQLTKTLWDIFINPDSILQVVFNEKLTFTVKDGLNCMPLQQLNHLMYQNFFQYTYRGALAQLRSKETDIWTLYLKTVGSFILGKFCN